MSKTQSMILRGAVSAALLVFLLSRIDYSVFWSHVKEANMALVVLAATLFFSGIYFSILRWNHFLRFYGLTIKKTTLFNLYLTGAFLNNFLPSSIGGDGYKIYDLAKTYPGKKKEVVSSIIFERGSGFLLLLIVNFCLFLVFYRQIAVNNVLIFATEIGMLTGVAVVIVFRRCLLGLLDRFHFKIALVNKLVSLLKVVFSFDHKTIFLKGLFYSFLFSLNAAIGAWILFVALGTKVDLFYILFVSSFSQIVSILPISINALGILEGASVFLYSIAGISPEISLAVALIARISMMMTSSIGGISLLLKGGRPPEQPVPEAVPDSIRPQ